MNSTKQFVESMCHEGKKTALKFLELLRNDDTPENWEQLLDSPFTLEVAYEIGRALHAQYSYELTRTPLSEQGVFLTQANNFFCWFKEYCFAHSLNFDFGEIQKPESLEETLRKLRAPL